VREELWLRGILMPAEGFTEDRVRERKIVALGVMSLGVLVLVTSLIRLISLRLSLPPWSVQTEGKYVAYGMEVWGLLFFVLPAVVSLFLLSYLFYPLRIKKFTVVLRLLFVTLMVCGFGASASLIGSAIINNPPLAGHLPIFVLKSFLGTSPFWIMGILSFLAFRRDRVYKKT
jgi:hypothetical protein